MTKELKKIYSLLQFIVILWLFFVTNNSLAIPVQPSSNNYSPNQNDQIVKPNQTAYQLKQSNKNTATPQAFNDPKQPENLNNNSIDNSKSSKIIKDRAKKQAEQETKSWEAIVQKKSEKAIFIEGLMDINYNDKNPPKGLYTRSPSNSNHHLPPVYFKSYYLSLAFKAAEINDINSLNAVLSKFNFLNGQNKDGDTLLMHAIQYSSLSVARSLIAKGALVDAINNRKRTALHYAATIGDQETAKLLLSMGADFALVDDREMTALDYAKANNNQEIAIMIDQYYKYNSIKK